MAKKNEKEMDPKNIWARAKEALLRLSKDINRNYFEIGQKLHDANRDKLWAVEYASLDEFVEKELEFRKSKAYQLIEIYEIFGKEFGYTAETIEEKNWTKLRGLIRLHKDGLITKKNIGEWMEKIGSLRGEDFDRTIALALGKEDPKDIKATRFTFVTENPDQAKVINDAIDHVLKSLGQDMSRTAALEFICADYMAGVDPETPSCPDRILKQAEMIQEKMKENEGKNEKEPATKKAKAKEQEQAEADRPY